MATVHLAVASGPSGFNKLVVLKILKRGLAEDPAFREMFLREARVAARLNHPGIVQTYEVFEARGAPVIVMQYLDGQTLAKLRQRAKGTFPLDTHLRIIADATGALHHAHDLADYDGRPVGLVHRDMTPQNIFVTFDGQVKLLDFGIAKLTTSNPETQTGVIKGKLRYMPPEQIAGEPVDRRTDIYAIGVMLWEAATGQPMWKGCSDVTVMKNVLSGEVVLPRSVQPQIPELLEAICMKALSPAPADRHATAAELEAELETLLDELSSRVNARVVGKFASTLFADIRAQTKALIETQLSEAALLPPEEFELFPSEDVESIRMPAFGSSSSEDSKVGRPTTVARPAVPRSSNEETKVASRPPLRIPLGFVPLGVLLVSIALASGTNATNAISAATAAPSSSVFDVRPGTAAPALPDLATRVSIRVTATPPQARVRIDGELLPSNPYVRSMPSDAWQHIVTVEAPGYKSRSATVSAERDGEFVVDLEHAPAPSPGTRVAPMPGVAPVPRVVAEAVTPRVAPSAAAPAKPRPTPVANCSPPFRIDASGIKHFKLECL